MGLLLRSFEASFRRSGLFQTRERTNSRPHGSLPLRLLRKLPANAGRARQRDLIRRACFRQQGCTWWPTGIASRPHLRTTNRNGSTVSSLPPAGHVKGQKLAGKDPYRPVYPDQTLASRLHRARGSFRRRRSLCSSPRRASGFSPPFAFCPLFGRIRYSPSLPAGLDVPSLARRT